MGSSDIEEFPHIQDPFIEFRAGKMRLEGTRVVPDSRKGLIRVGRGEEGLVHFQWLDRTRNVVEDDQIIFPHETVFEKVNQSSGRVYILKFNTDDRKFFFWMQEPNAERDRLLSSALNLCLKRRPLEDGVEEPFVPRETPVDLVDRDISLRPGSLIRPSIVAGPSIVAEANSDVTSSGPVKLTDLQRILSNIGSADDNSDPDAGLGLVDILKPELILPLITDLPVEQQLASYLPEGSWTPHELAELLQSPPFRQQLDSFSYMLRTGQIDLSQFGIDPRNYKLTVPSFLEALEDSVSESEESRTKTHEPMDEGQ